MTYKLLKKVISAGEFEKEDMLQKLDVYLAFDRITQEQYTELAGLVGGKEG